MPDSEAPFSTCRFYTFNMPFFSSAISSCRIQQHHFATCRFSFLQHAFFYCSNFNMPESAAPFFNMPFSFLQHASCLCSNFNMPDSATQFQHAGFSSFLQHASCLCSNFNMPDSATPFFHMPFLIPSTCLFLSVAISTCRIQQHHFQHDEIHVFQHAGFHSHILWEMSTSVADNVNKYCSHFMF